MEDRLRGGALMMWANVKPLVERVSEASVYFQSKFGLAPNIVIANEFDVVVDGNTLMTVMGIDIHNAKWVPQGHIYIGYLEDKSIWID